MKTSNKFTLVRVIAAPLFLVIYMLPDWLRMPQSVSIALTAIAFPLLAFAEFTDFLDGHFARKHNEVSDFGKMFDPFADVFLHMTTFLTFTIEFNRWIPIVCFVLIFYREFTMNFFRMVAAKKGTAIAARKGGKAKTVFYVFTEFYFLVIAFIGRAGWWPSAGLENAFTYAGYALFAACVVFAYVSFADYVKNFGYVLKEGAEDKQ